MTKWSAPCCIRCAGNTRSAGREPLRSPTSTSMTPWVWFALSEPPATSRGRTHELTLVRKPDAGRSSRQDCSPVGESPTMSIAQNRHVAMPHPGRGNPPGDAWCKRPGRPMLQSIAVGVIGRSSKGRSLKMNECLQPRKRALCGNHKAGMVSCAERVSRNVRPQPRGKKWVSALRGHGGVWDQAPTQGVQR